MEIDSGKFDSAPEEPDESWPGDALSNDQNDLKFTFKEKDFAGRFLKSLHEFQTDKSFCDIVIRVDNETVQAHRLVLAASIPFFRAMFNSHNSNMRENTSNEIEIKEQISFDAFLAIIDYAYSGNY